MSLSGAEAVEVGEKSSRARGKRRRWKGSGSVGGGGGFECCCFWCGGRVGEGEVLGGLGNERNREEKEVKGEERVDREEDGKGDEDEEGKERNETEEGGGDVGGEEISSRAKCRSTINEG